PLEADGGACQLAEQLYAELDASGLDILIDDSEAQSQEKLRRADLLGIPLQILVSGEPSEAEAIEIRERASSVTHRVVATEVKALLRGRAGVDAVDSNR